MQATKGVTPYPGGPLPGHANEKRAAGAPFLIENVSIVNFKEGTGLRVRDSASVVARNMHFSGDRVAIEVRDDAQLDDYGTVIE